MNKKNDPVELLSGKEKFSLNGKNESFTVLDFWRFQFSNLPDIQGRVGEFIVAMALKKELPDNNNGWTPWDITYRETRIEIKTTAYYQPWREEGEYSEQRSFGITKSIDPDDKQRKRMNDIYVFVLNTGKDREKANPLMLEHWRFWIIPTSLINEKCDNNKSITLGKVQTLASKVEKLKDLADPKEGFTYDQLRNAIDTLIESL